MCYNENKVGYVVKKNGCTCSDNENKGGYVVKKNGCTCVTMKTRVVMWWKRMVVHVVTIVSTHIMVWWGLR